MGGGATALGLLWIGWALNFFLTANPYSAYKGGVTALDTHLQSDAFYFHSGLVMTVSLLLAWGLAGRKIFLSPVVTLGLGALILASAFNGTLGTRPQSVGFDFTMFLLTSFLAFQDARNKTSVPLNVLFGSSAGFIVLAIALAAVRPGIWGNLYFEFSRYERTELIFAAMMAAPLLMSVSLFAAAPGIWSVAALLWGLALIISVAGGNRTDIVVALSPALIVAFLHGRSIPRTIVAVCLVAAVLGSLWYFSVSALELADLEFTSDSELGADVVSGGRLGLFLVHLQAFANAPVVGAGAFFLDQAIPTDLRAESEVGVARAFSEYGVAWGLFELGMAAVAAAIAVSALRRSQSVDPTLRFLALLMLTMLPHFLVHGLSRILTAADFLFWYTVFRLVAEYGRGTFLSPRVLRI